jgi:hypothetical protein
VFKQLITLMMAFSLMASSAFAKQTGLRDAFNDLSYSLTVEWDQQDKAFYNQQLAKFTATVKELQAQGMTDAELIAFATSSIKDQNVARDVEAAFNIVKLNKMPTDDASRLLLDTMNRSFDRGASWTGGVALYYAISAILVVAIVVAVATSDSGTSGSSYSNPNPYCTQVYQCQPFCYNDALWGYTCQQQCFWTTLCY